VTAARRITTFQQRSQFRTWLHRIAVNTSLDHLDRQRRRPELLLDDQTPDLPAPRADPALRLDIDTALRSLPPSFREAVILRDLCDLDYDEIATRLDVPLGTVRSRIARGRDQLAELLGSQALDPN
jgi:RNA polymerase sigma-70 factor, ECF subfamily